MTSQHTDQLDRGGLQSLFCTVAKSSTRAQRRLARTLFGIRGLMPKYKLGAYGPHSSESFEAFVNADVSWACASGSTLSRASSEMATSQLLLANSMVVRESPLQTITTENSAAHSQNRHLNICKAGSFKMFAATLLGLARHVPRTTIYLSGWRNLIEITKDFGTD